MAADEPAGYAAAMALLDKLGLHRPALRAWAMYDWANSAFITIVVTAIFPSYYIKVANASDVVSDPAIATGRLAITTTIALTLVAVLAPILGAIADAAPTTLRDLGRISGIGPAKLERYGDAVVALIASLR